MTYKELKGAVDRLAGFFNVEGRQVLFSLDDGTELELLSTTSSSREEEPLGLMFRKVTGKSVKLTIGGKCVKRFKGPLSARSWIAVQMNSAGERRKRQLNGLLDLLDAGCRELAVKEWNADDNEIPD